MDDSISEPITELNTDPIPQVISESVTDLTLEPWAAPFTLATDVLLESPEAAEPTDPRLVRIAELTADSLAKGDPLEATVGGLNSDLMFVAHMLMQVLNESWQESPETIRAMAEFMPAVDNFLKVSKQIGSMTQLSIKLRALNGSA